MSGTINHVTLLLLLLSSFIVRSVHPSCPAGCTCIPDHSVREVHRAVRMTCSGRPGDIGEVPDDMLDEVDGNVTHLDLSGNELVTIEKDFNMFRFPYVRHLNLSHNRLKSIERGALGRFKFLKTLDISNNHLKQLDHGFFASDDELKEKEEEDEEDDEPNDYDHRRSDDDDDDDDDDDMVRGFPSLKRSLIELDLSHNHLNSIDGVFDQLESLTKLNLNDNRLENITSITFRRLSRLRWLVLNSNRLRQIDSDAFSGTVRLNNLMMKDNPDLQQLDRLNLKTCPYLNYLDISECGLTSTPKILPDSLRYLQLRRNQLTKIDSDSFKECSGLNILLLDCNKISTIEEDAFENMINLQQLWLNENLLTSVPKHLPKSLHRLLLDSNQLTSWPFDVFRSTEDEPTSLSILSLSGNQISEIEIETYKKLTRLSSLDLSDNRIQSLPYKAFSKSLSSLNMNKNPLKYFHDGCMEGLSSLKNLFLSFVDTPLENLSVSRVFLKPLQEKLKTLEIDHSPSLARLLISGPTFEDSSEEEDFTVSSLTNLDEISFTGLDLTTISKEDMNNFIPTNLKALRFSSTRWHCDKSLIWLQDWMKEKSTVLQTASSNLCYTPRSIHGKPLTSLAVRDFVIATAPTLSSRNPTRSTFKSIQPSAKSRSSISSTLRNSVKSSRKVHTTPRHDAWPDEEQMETNASPDYAPSKKTVELLSPPKNDEDSLISHVSDFISRTETEEKISDGGGGDDGGGDDDGGGGGDDDGGGGGDDDGVWKEEVIDKNANVEKTETEISPDQNPSPETETPEKPSEPVDRMKSFEKYFQQYFPSDEVESPRHVDSTSNNTYYNIDNNSMRNSIDVDMIERNGFIVTIAIIIIAITAIIAAFIIFLIILTCRKKRKPPKETLTSVSKDSLADSNKTIIKYKNKDGVLYFSTSSMTGMDTEYTDVNSSGSTRPSIADRKYTTEQTSKYRNSPTLSEAKSALFAANGGAANMKQSGSCNSSCNNHTHHNHIHHNNFNNNNSNKTLSYRWEDT